MVLAGIGVGLVSSYDSRPKQRIKSCYCNSIATINRKAPAFLQGLLSLVRYGAEDEVRTRDPNLIRLYQAGEKSNSLLLRPWIQHPKLRRLRLSLECWWRIGGRR